MKQLNNLANSFVKKLSFQEPKMIHAIQHPFVLKHLDDPIMSDQATCPICEGQNGMHCLIDQNGDDKRIWFCLEADCLALVKRSKPIPTLPTLNPSKLNRALVWGLFCEMNNIGDIYEDVKFEAIKQAQAKVDYLLKFSKNPTGIILMQGDKGTGKTYAALGLCELFIKTNPSCLFYTQDRLSAEWIAASKSDSASSLRDLMDKLSIVSLLVIDDFGTKEPSAGFLQFFMGIINTRMQYKSRGTVITTNLNSSSLGTFCGDALMDRINTGQSFLFTGATRRLKKSI
jgi:IstB-like ATP binding protein